NNMAKEEIEIKYDPIGITISPEISSRKLFILRNLMVNHLYVTKNGKLEGIVFKHLLIINVEIIYSLQLNMTTRLKKFHFFYQKLDSTFFLGCIKLSNQILHLFNSLHLLNNQ